tara:strand:- start:7422 stop:7562 length:141 start_codon:yes stop_codon:yes gene_type:complete
MNPDLNLPSLSVLIEYEKELRRNNKIGKSAFMKLGYRIYKSISRQK